MTGTVIRSEGARYELLRELASGGMATVFLARVTGPVERRVALKRIHPHLAKDQSFRAMFLDEARIVARIDHPNVCKVLDYGESEGEAFIAMELLSGVTLQRILVRLARRSPSDPQWFRFVCTVIAEAAEGLHAAHEARGDDGSALEIVHRDISPSNLFLTHDGQVKVLDFGIAKARDRLHVSSTGEVKGKFSYMPPEQLHGRAERRSDVWSLGVVLYELLTLRPLFRRDTQPETIIAVERLPVQRVDAVRPELAGYPTEAVLDALRRDVDQRLPDAKALADRLQQALTPFGGLMSRREIVAYLEETLGDLAPSRVSSPPPPTTPSSATPTEDRADAPPEAAVATPTLRPRGVGLWIAAAVSALAGVGAVLGVASMADDDVETPVVARAADAGDLDAGDLDAGDLDAGDLDAGDLDASDLDGGVVEAGPTDPSLPRVDAGARDAPRPRPVPRRDGGRPTPAPEPPQQGHGHLFVPSGVAVCVDRRCASRADAVFGPRRVRLPAGAHRVYYVTAGEPLAGPAVVLGEAEVTVPANGQANVPRR